MDEIQRFLLASAGVCTAVFIYNRATQKTDPAPLPPGPKGLPVIGNLPSLPQNLPWKTFAKWGETYGGILHVSALGTHLVVLNDPKYAIEMLDKKGRLYSDRPLLMMAGRLVGWDEGPALIGFNDTWGEYRRLMASFMGTKSKIAEFTDILQSEAEELVRRMVAAPQDFVSHAKNYAGAIVLLLAYGYRANDGSDPMVKLVGEAMDQFSETTVSNAFLVDAMPALRFVPEWFPGAGWKVKANKYRRTLEEMLTVPYEWSKQQIAAGTAIPSFLTNMLCNEKQHSAKNERDIQWTAAGIYSGGADTTVAGITSFILALARNTDVLRRIHAEIDEVIGSDRLPTLEDRQSLPYLEAAYTESMRKYPIAPMALPHVVTEDDVHDGFFIPKGAIVFANVWQYCRDPQVYPNPEEFLPDRFLATKGKPAQKHPKDFVFGFGRRVCPGIQLADPSMWLACAAIAAGFEILPPIKEGKPVTPPEDFLDGSISHPAPFECRITPRSRMVESVLRHGQ